MWKFLEKIRQKPDPQKKLIALISSAVITLIIVLIWLPTVFDNKEEVVDDIKKDVEERNLVSEVTPISNLGAQVGEIKGMWKEITSQFKNSNTNLEIESNVQ